MGGEVSFLSPLAALAGLALAVPLVLLALSARRHRAVRAALRIREPAGRPHVPAVVALVVAFGLLAAAAAQPVVRLERQASVRMDVQAFVVVDTTRSMLASSSPDAPRRIERAKELAIELRRELPDVPFGVATLTDRVLPHLFPTADLQGLEVVLRDAVGVNRPPGTRGGPLGIGTDLAALRVLATDNYFSPTSTRRIAVVLSDGESVSYTPVDLAERLAQGGVEVVLVRTWREDERVWQADGVPEPAYVPRSGIPAQLADLGALTRAGRVFGEGELDAAAAAARALAGSGPAVALPATARTVSLAPYAALAAFVPLALLAASGLGLRRGRLDDLAYSMLARWRASSPTRPSRSRGTRARWRPSSSGLRSSLGGSSPDSA